MIILPLSPVGPNISTLRGREREGEKEREREKEKERENIIVI